MAHLYLSVDGGTARRAAGGWDGPGAVACALNVALSGVKEKVGHREAKGAPERVLDDGFLVEAIL